MKQAPGRVAGRLSRSAETASGFGEGVLVGGDRLVHGLVRCQVVVFLLKLAIEPIGEVAHRIGDNGLGIADDLDRSRTVPRHRDRHGENVIVIAAMRDLGAQLVEILSLRRLHGQIGHDRHEAVANDQSLQIGRDHTLSIGQNQTASIAGDLNLNVGGAHSRTVTGDDRVTVSQGNQSVVVARGKQEVQVLAAGQYTTVNNDIVTVSQTGGVSVKAATSVVLDAPTILLRANDSNFIMVSQGQIVIEGAETFINPRENAPET